LKFIQRGRKDEVLFSIEKESAPVPSAAAKKMLEAERHQTQSKQGHPIKDLKEYEFFLKNKSFFSG